MTHNEIRDLTTLLNQILAKAEKYHLQTEVLIFTFSELSQDKEQIKQALLNSVAEWIPE